MIDLALILVAVATWVALFKGDPAELTGTEYDAGADLEEPLRDCSRTGTVKP